ncbi:putative S-phase kinase-associated protein [Rosa chinensis]|uniref:SKP1-like protein n=1 Tax=Rosa chinensis TaxID=74649 RepID=A0A2P6Q891_ROSCH|nr:SKP1-like protein 1A [Rosa chinensis]PRQ30398.1 putative S-phase kinase-associated protein [Rosa chinensis]
MSTSADNKASITQESGPSAAVQDIQKKIVVRTADGEVFNLKEEVAMEIDIIKTFFQEDGISYETVMPLPNVEGWEMVKVIEYCTKHVELKHKVDGHKELKAFQALFVQNLSTKSLLALTNTANYLEVKYLLDFLCQAVSEQIKNKDVDYVRELFGVENDFNDEEYEQVKAEAPWAHENLNNDLH